MFTTLTTARDDGESKTSITANNVDGAAAALGQCVLIDGRKVDAIIMAGELILFGNYEGERRRRENALRRATVDSEREDESRIQRWLRLGDQSLDLDLEAEDDEDQQAA